MNNERNKGSKGKVFAFQVLMFLCMIGAAVAAWGFSPWYWGLFLLFTGIWGWLLAYGRRLNKNVMAGFMLLLILSIPPANAQELYTPKPSAAPDKLDQELLGYDIKMLTGEDQSHFQANSVNGVYVLPIGCAIVAGAVAAAGIGYALIKICQNAFNKPKNTNSPPEEESSGSIAASEEEDDSYAGANTFTSCGSCEGRAYSLLVPTFIEFYVHIDYDDVGNPQVRLSDIRSVPAGTNDLVNFSEMREYLLTQGVNWEGRVGEVLYGKNGRPASPEEMPFEFLPGGILRVKPEITDDPTEYTVVIERSMDLKEWTYLMPVIMPAGKKIPITDSSFEGMQFFRARINQW